LDEAASGTGTSTPAAKQVGTFFSACMDEKGIEARGAKPLDVDLAVISGIATRADLLPAIATLFRRGVYSAIDLSAEQDFTDSTRMIASADRAGFSLRVKENYSSDSEHAKSLRATYERHLTRVFGLLGEPADVASMDAKRVLELEAALAASSRDLVTRRDPKKRNNPVSVVQPAKGAFDWRTFLAHVGTKTVTTVNLHDPDYFEGLTKLLATVDLATWRAYLRARLVHTMANMLPSAFVETDYDFYKKTLRGTKELAPRWKRCADMVDDGLGEAVGQLFVARAFPEANKAKVLALVEAVRESLRVALATAPWLGDATRRAALAKLAAVRVKIGYPDHFRDYSSIRLAKDDVFGSAERAATFELERQLSKIGRPVDHDEWFELPQSLDAYGTNQLNEVAFTAGFLQPPIFDPAADDASTFGGLGAVIGHELTHRFDDSGRAFDDRGNLRDWWTTEDAKEYQSRAACFSAQYASYAIAGEHLDGKLTLGENIADNGGLRLAFRAARLEGAQNKGSPAAQRFFTAWAHIRCANVTDEMQRSLLRSDPHSPGRYRAIGAISNMPDFLDAFQCPSTSPMKNEPVCRLW
jgi:endothelin-converting enzyme/putative endopeptidase